MYLAVPDAGNEPLTSSTEPLTCPWTQECVRPAPYSSDSEPCVHDVDICVAVAEGVKKDCICGQEDRLGTSLGVLCDPLCVISVN